MNTVVVLNGDFSFLNTVHWRRAIALHMKGKTEVLKYSSRKIMCSNGNCIRVPLVMRLIKVIRMIYRNKVPFSKRNVMIRDDFKCVYCGSNKHLTIDHILPQSRGGKTTFENCVTACRPCNHKKGNKTASEAMLFLKKIPSTPTISEFLRIKMKQLGVDSFLKEMGVF